MDDFTPSSMATVLHMDNHKLIEKSYMVLRKFPHSLLVSKCNTHVNNQL